MGKRSGDCALKVAAEDTGNTLPVYGACVFGTKQDYDRASPIATPEDITAPSYCRR